MVLSKASALKSTIQMFRILLVQQQGVMLEH